MLLSSSCSTVPARAQLFWSDVSTQRIHCSERSSSLKSTPAELWLNMWRAARENVCVYMPESWILACFLHVCVWKVALYRGGWLRFRVCAAAFKLLGVVWGHVWKVSEDVLVGFITWKRAKKKTWALALDVFTRTLTFKNCKSFKKIHVPISAISSGFQFLAWNPLF